MSEVCHYREGSEVLVDVAEVWPRFGRGVQGVS